MECKCECSGSIGIGILCECFMWIANGESVGMDEGEFKFTCLCVFTVLMGDLSMIAIGDGVGFGVGSGVG